MPQIEGDLPPLREWCIPGGIGGPSDPTWQTGSGKQQPVRRHPALGTGWTKPKLASWGVPWPPPRGWRKRLLRKDPLHQCGRPVVLREDERSELLDEDVDRISEFQRLMYRDA